MNPGGWSIGLTLAYAACVSLAWRYVRWPELLADRGLQHRIGLAVVLLTLLWSLRAGLSSTLEVHFFMVSALHLIFGWQFALLIVTAVLLLLGLFGGQDWHRFGLDGVVSGVIPILCTYGFWTLHRRFTAHHPFAFIFLVAALGAAVAVLVSCVFLSAVLWLNGDATVAQLQRELWLFLPLMALPEGVVNGMLIAAMIVYVPDWVRLFEERRYR